MAAFISAWPPYRRKELVILLTSIDLGASHVEKHIVENSTKLTEAMFGDSVDMSFLDLKPTLPKKDQP